MVLKFDTGAIPITRVVGPGLFFGAGSHYNADGSLRDWQTLAGNNVVGPKAFVKVFAASTDAVSSHTFKFAMNGQLIGEIEVPAAPNVNEARFVEKCIEVSTGLVRFARRIPGSTPTPGNNVFTVSGTTWSLTTLFRKSGLFRRESLVSALRPCPQWCLFMASGQTRALSINSNRF